MSVRVHALLAVLTLGAGPALAQAATDSPPAVAEAGSPADRAAAAAERAAAAAETAAKAAQRIADAVNPPVPAAPAAPAAPAGDKPAWTGSVGLGLAFITGNTQTLTGTASGALDGKLDGWGLGLRLSAAYGIATVDTRAATPTEIINARRGLLTVRGDRSFGIASVFLLGGAEFDHVKSIEFRGVGEGGASLTLLNQKRGEEEALFLRFDLSLRGGYETRFQYFPRPSRLDPAGIPILAPRFNLVFRWTPNSFVRLSQEIEAMPFLLAPTFGRVILNSLTKLNAKLVGNVSLATSFLLNVDTSPPGGIFDRVQTPAGLYPVDASLTVGVEAAF